MADETTNIPPHEHKWWLHREPDGRLEVMANSSCAICGLTPEAVANQAAIVALLRENAAMREIVQAVATEDTIARQGDAGDDYSCVFCVGEDDWRVSSPSTVFEHFKHTSDCPVTKARALLATEEQA